MTNTFTDNLTIARPCGASLDLQNPTPVKRLLAGADWHSLRAQCLAAAPEAFDAQGQPLNLKCGEWAFPGHGKIAHSPVDGAELGRFPMLSLDEAKKAVAHGALEAKEWAKTPLDERKSRVAACLDALETHHELMARLLVWEIGKPLAQSRVSVERCISGVRWYLENIETMLAPDGKMREPLGLVSNIASWNYPMSVLMHAVLVQVLCGNAAIAKTPSDGGLWTLTLAFALARRAGLPVSLVSGSGGQLSEALVRNDHVACLAFVGGKTNGRDIAAALFDARKRYMLEMEGVNAYGIWNFSDWKSLESQLKKGFEYGKQRCTAYARFVVQRELMPQFLEMYLPLLKTLRFGHPLLVASGENEAPALDFGPLINPKKVEELRVLHAEALGAGAVPLYTGEFDESRFFAEQDISSYLPPMALLNVPKNCRLYHNEPFGPIDSIIVVDRPEELVAEMNVSNGCLVSSIASDDEKAAKALAGELRAFKVGINKVRSRGDKDEAFGGIGQSWKGCFVGGKYLVEAVTQGEAGEKLVGRFPDGTVLPDIR